MPEDILSSNDTKRSRFSIVLKIICFASLYMAVHMVTPFLTLQYFKHQGYAFLKDVAFVYETFYQRDVIDHDETVVFQYETLISMDHVTIDANRYDIVFSDATLFDIGMMSDSFSVDPISFYAFEFLYGDVFMSDDEIVISESVSNLLFGKADSVGESIVIKDVMFNVSGVVKEDDPSMAYIYIPNDQLENMGSSISEAFTFRVFKDQDIHSKLYDHGGIELINQSTSLYNQFKIRSSSRMIINLIFIVISLVILGISNLKYQKKQHENISFLKGPQPPFIKSMLSSFLHITWMLIFLFLIFVSTIASISSYRVGFRYLLHEGGRFSFLFMVYLVPLVIYGIRKFVIYIQEMKK